MSKFKVGDKVICITDYWISAEKGKCYVVETIETEEAFTLKDNLFSYPQGDFELAISKPTPQEMKRGYWTKTVQESIDLCNEFYASKEVSVPASGGVKHDEGKPQLNLLSPIWITGVGTVLSFGAKKYAPYNYRKGIKISRFLAASLRHIFAFIGGETNDPESKQSHLYHASACLMMAAEVLSLNPEMDDRDGK